MESKESAPDYPLDDTLELTSVAQVRAVGHPLRSTLLNLLHERAATVTELAAAVRRPKSTVAHHVKVLTSAGLLKVTSTRQVRAVQERYYGRTARAFFYGDVGQHEIAEPLDFNDFEVAARESATAFEEGELWSFIRHARIEPERRAEFWSRVRAVVDAFDRLPRAGGTSYGFVVGVYPVRDYPMLPPAD